MMISTDFLAGLVLGVLAVLLFQQATRLSNRLLSPGCLLPLALVVILLVILILTGIINIQLWA